MPCFPLAGHSGRQRRPHKGLYGFCNPVMKPQFRGCSNFNLADLGVANFTANLAGYSAMYVVLCCTAKGSDTMAKRRPSGDGMVRKREDGRWEGRIVVGHKKNGDPIHRYVLARTQKELTEKLHDCIEMYRDADLTEDSNMTLGKWLDQWINEIIRFLHQAKEEGYYELFLLELGTGMRRGEILALKWSDLNFKTGELDIERQVYIIKAEVIISEPKTKASIRTVILPPSLLKTLAVYKETVDSEWMFPSPTDNGRPRNPSSVRKRLQLILERAGCKKVRFHDLRHTFATMALEHGMDVKTLSATIGHVSSATTLDIYSHITDTMQRQAAVHIDRKIGGTDAQMPTIAREERKDTSPVEFTPYKPKIQKPGTGCVTMINDHLYEGRYTPTNAYGKWESHNIYAKTREECKEKLAEMIAEVKAQIKAEKERLKAEQEA